MPTINIDRYYPYTGYRSETGATGTGQLLLGDNDHIWPDTRKSLQDRTGWRPPMGWSRTKAEGCTRTAVGNIRVDYEWNFSPNHYSTYVGPLTGNAMNAAIPSFPNGLISRAEVNALLKLKDQKVNLAVAYAEATKTAEHLTKTALRLRRMVKAARRLDVRKFLEIANAPEVHGRVITVRKPRKKRRKPHDRYPKPLGYEVPFSDGRVSSLVLEHSYAWKPLLSDAKGVWDEFVSNNNKNSRRIITVFGFANERYESVVDKPFSCPNPVSLIQGLIEVRRRGIHRCKVRLDYELDNPALVQASAVGLTNPLEVAWEVVPFSFVVDWFYPVGDYLSSLDAAVGYRFLGGSRSVTTKENSWGRVKTESIFVNSIHARKQKVSNGSPIATAYKTNFDRHIYGASPVPLVPRIDRNGLDAGSRFLNALALLSQAIRGV